MKNQTIFHYEGTNLGITDSFKSDGQTPNIKLLDFQVVPATAELQQDLFLESGDFVYEIKRLRLFDDQPFMIEHGYIPIKIAPELSQKVVSGSIFNYLEDEQNKVVTKSFMTMRAAPSTSDDQKLLGLSAVEPIASWKASSSWMTERRLKCQTCGCAMTILTTIRL